MAANRKLVAIVFADIAGFTDLANRDERLALSVKDAVEKQVKAATLLHHGRVVKMLGDGGMLEFASAVEAVTCAIALQESMADVNRGLNTPEEIQLRVGVHVGDVVQEGDDIFGNAVNIASRVQAMATPGRICITREVFMQIRPILNLRCSPVSVRADGRMPEPVEVLQIDGGQALHPGAERPRYRLAFAMLGVLAAVAAVAYWVRPPSVAATSTPAAVHRILLPDWVSPGEWFALDAGEKAKSLSVYFGNRQAKTKLQDQKLMVQTPGDLPSEKTTISVFQDNESQPMLTQATHIVRPKVASFYPMAPNPMSIRKKPDVSDEELMREDLRMQLEEEPPAEEPVLKLTPIKPPTPTPAPAKRVQVGDKVLTMASLDEIGKALDEELVADGGPTPPEGKAPPKFEGPAGNAVIAIRSAKSGDPKHALELVDSTRKQLKDLPEETRREIEAALKTVEAMAADQPGRKGVDGKAMAKWAESFAFTMNNGTRSFSGIAMVNRMIQAGRKDEARRALNLMKQREDLSVAEKKAMDRLQTKLDADKP